LALVFRWQWDNGACRIRVRILEVSESDRVALERRVRDRGGLSGPDIADWVGCTEPRVVLWRHRYAAEGAAGLDDRPRKLPPRTRVTDEVRDGILTVTLTRPPASGAAMGTIWATADATPTLAHDASDTGVGTPG
jgi:hypothetical protein